MPLSAGSFVYIESGVFHRTQAAPHSHLDLIEVENPRNKFDLLRVGDEYGRTAKGYEPSAVSHEGLEPMQEMGRAILYRSRDVTGTYTFAVTRLGSDHRSDATLRAAVLMDIRHHLSGRICLLVPDRHDFTEHAGSLALLIREGTFASTP
ncbi:GTP-binding protein Obg [plant metagenome]|uniref:GTP-binding protein Obg n=1 Tax=plant metagenome TaxID=1297885 RepID=A0A484PKH7_9ZZZZ